MRHVLSHVLPICMLVALASAPLVMGACKASDDSGLKKPKGVNKMAYPVSVAPLTMRQVKYNVTAPGSLDAFQQVQITARVAGAVDKVGFVEGQTVKKGDLLVLIEPDRYQVAVDQAKSAVDKAAATEKSAEAELARRQQAVADHPGLVAGEEVETYATNVQTTKADVAAAQENVRVAQLNMRDAFVRAPFTGVIQSRSVQEGQYLQPGAILGTLLQRDPLLLRFGVSESDAPRLTAGMTANITMRESTNTYTAKLILVAEAADPTTRLVPVTGQVDDTVHKYWLRPGAFCEVTIPIGDARAAIVVPSIAVQPTDSGNVVYTVDDKNIAHLKKVQLGMYTPEGGVELTTGVSAGDLLVVEGYEALTEGAPVQIKSRTTVEAAEAAGSAESGPAGSASGAPRSSPSAGGAPPMTSARASSSARAPGATP
jgi:membrane fusion protein, multidrug efflux system